MPKEYGAKNLGDSEIDALVQRAADAKRTADELIRQIQELAREVERLKSRRENGGWPRRKS